MVEGEVQFPKIWAQAYDVRVDVLVVDDHAQCAYRVLEKRSVFWASGIRELEDLPECSAMVCATQKRDICEQELLCIWAPCAANERIVLEPFVSRYEIIVLSLLKDLEDQLDW